MNIEEIRKFRKIHYPRKISPPQNQETSAEFIARGGKVIHIPYGATTEFSQSKKGQEYIKKRTASLKSRTFRV